MQCSHNQPACCERGLGSRHLLAVLPALPVTAHVESAWCTGKGGRGWAPQHALGGHYGAVVDMGWDAEGRCLHTVSEDQTARIFSTCDSHWCEIARPQVGHCGSTMIAAPLCLIWMVFWNYPSAAACVAA